MKLKIERDQYTMKGKSCFILNDVSMYLERQTASFIEIVLTVFFTIIATTYWMPTRYVRCGLHFLLILTSTRSCRYSRMQWKNLYQLHGSNFGGIWKQASSVNVHVLPNYSNHPVFSHSFNPNHTHKCLYIWKCWWVWQDWLSSSLNPLSHS